MNPLEAFFEDRQRARDAGDPMAALCSVANMDSDGNAQLRTLVLRDMEERLAVFVNATSPKWSQLHSGFAVLTYWPSVQIQYRMQVRPEAIPAELVHESWQLRPDAPKRMDWFYQTTTPQSTPVESRDELLAQVGSLELPDPLVAPGNARGLYLDIQTIERLDLTQENGIHARTYSYLNDGEWHTRTLVP